MFNNYKVNLLNHQKLNEFFLTLSNEQQEELQAILCDVEQLLNADMQEKEKLLNVVNNLQLQTQNKLNLEMSKNFQFHQQTTQLQEIINKQTTEIAFLNKSVQNVYQEQFDLFSPHKQSHSPTIQRTQSINKHRRRRITEKENENFVCIYSSIKKVKSQEFFSDEYTLKEHYVKEMLDQQLFKEQQIFKFCKQMQQIHMQKQIETQTYIDTLISEIDQQYKQYLQLQQKYEEQQFQFDTKLSKYSLAFKYLVNNNNKSQIQEIIENLKQMVSIVTSSDSQEEQLIEILMNFSSTRDTLYKLQQNQSNTFYQRQEIDLNKQMNDFIVQIQDLQLQRQELLELGQSMNEQIIAQNQQIKDQETQNQSLTQLFSKSLQDLEQLQEENECLRKSHSQMVTSRTQDGSINQKHFMQNRYSTYLEGRQRESLSCKNSFKVDTRHFKFDFSSENKRQQIQEIDEICVLLDQILNRGFDAKLLDYMNNFSCNSGNFKMQLLWQKLKDLLLNYYYSIHEMDNIFDKTNQFINDMNLRVQYCDNLSEVGTLFIYNKLEMNQQSICSMLHYLVNDIHNIKTQSIVESVKMNRENSQNGNLQQLSQNLIDICLSNDNVILKEIDQQIKLQRQFKQQKNKKLRDLQTSTCKMLMEVFKKWKQNYLQISELLFIIMKGGQLNQEDFNKLNESELGTVIRQELKTFLLMIYQQ